MSSLRRARHLPVHHRTSAGRISKLLELDHTPRSIFVLRQFRFASCELLLESSFHFLALESTIQCRISSIPSSIKPVVNPPSHGVFLPSAYPRESSDLHRAYLTRLCSAFRFSQPLDGLFRSHHLGFVSRRIRPWDFCFQRFPSSRSRHGFHRACPSISSPPSAITLVRFRRNFPL